MLHNKSAGGEVRTFLRAARQNVPERSWLSPTRSAFRVTQPVDSATDAAVVRQLAYIAQERHGVRCKHGDRNVCGHALSMLETCLLLNRYVLLPTVACMTNATGGLRYKEETGLKRCLKTVFFYDVKNRYSVEVYPQL